MNARIPRSVVLFALAGWLGALPCRVHAQAPTTADSQLLYPVVYEKQLGDIRKTAIELLRNIEKGLSEGEALVDQGKVKQLSETDIEAIHLHIIRLERAAERLGAWGELSGSDIVHRTKNYRIRLTKLAEQRVTDREFIVRLGNRMKKLEVDVQAALKRLPEVTRLVERQQPEQAQILYWKLTDGIDARTVWYGLKNVPNRPTSLTSLEVYRNSCFSATQKLWKAQALKVCAEAMASADTNYAKLIQQADQVAAAISKGPTVDFDGEKRTGPAAVAALGERWRQLDLATLQARGWAWCSGRIGGTDNKTALAVAQQSQGRNVAAALGRIIAADAGRAKPEESAALYREYVAQLSPLVILSGDAAINDAFQQPLAALAARSPSLLAEVTAYQNATGEILRWRERISASVARSRMAQAPAIEQLARTIASPLRDNRGPLLINEQSQVVSQATDPVPVLISRLAPLVSKQTTAIDLLSLGPEKLLAIGNYRQPMRCYVRVAPAAAKESITALGADLLSTDSQPPLTLEGKAALDGARQGDVMAAGGPILRLGLVAWGEHFARLPATQRGPVRLGPIPPDAVTSNELVLLVQLEARWMAGRHYFVDVPAAK